MLFILFFFTKFYVVYLSNRKNVNHTICNERNRFFVVLFPTIFTRLCIRTVLSILYDRDHLKWFYNSINLYCPIYDQYLYFKVKTVWSDFIIALICIVRFKINGLYLKQWENCMKIYRTKSLLCNELMVRATNAWLLSVCFYKIDLWLVFFFKK
jgi:hypothetical protein